MAKMEQIPLITVLDLLPLKKNTERLGPQMAKQIRRILKSNDVRLQGSFRLEMPKEKSPSSTTAQVRILENNPQFAVIEITCSCGEKTNIRCEYAASQTTSKTPQQKLVPEQHK